MYMGKASGVTKVSTRASTHQCHLYPFTLISSDDASARPKSHVFVFKAQGLYWQFISVVLEIYIDGNFGLFVSALPA